MPNTRLFFNVRRPAGVSRVTDSCSCAAITIALFDFLGTPGSTQEFEKDAVNNMFGKDTKVQMYDPKDSRRSQRGKSNEELDAERRQQQIAFLEAMCRNLGPKSSACTDLDEMKAEQSDGEAWE